MADILARQRTIVGTTAAWAADNLTLGDGEIALERKIDGTVWAKVGDGVTLFSAAPYLGVPLPVVTSYTDEQARDAVGAALAGEGIRTTVNDLADTITLRLTGIAPTVQASTGYTAVADDVGRYIVFTNAAATAFTIPPNSAVAFPLGTVMTIEQNGTGVVTITAGAGVTLNSRGGILTSAGRYAVVQVKNVAADVWTVIGDVA